MPFQIGNGCFPATISDNRINQIARSDTSPDVSVWEKVKAFFCSTNKPEALELIWQICHPPARTSREAVAGRFEQLRTLAYAGFEENVQSSRHGENHFCILDENSQEILSVTLDDTGKYTVECQGHSETHNLTPQEYEVVWSAWERAAPPEETADRAGVVRRLRNIQNRHSTSLHLLHLNISSLPDYLPPCIINIYIASVPLTCLPVLPHGVKNLSVSNAPLTSLPALPEGLQELVVISNQLTSTSLPALPEGLRRLVVSDNQLTNLPVLPERLQELNVSGNQLTRLPALPEGLQELDVSDNQLTRLPVLPERLQELVVRNNQLTRLPALPEGLQRLVVNGNQLTHLPALPEGLQELVISDNQLTRLPVLPERLQELVVRNNQLTRLPALPEGLQRLVVSNNPLTRLPVLPSGLHMLWCVGNQLTSLPESIAGLSSNANVYISNNPLSARTRQALVAMTSTPDYSGPRIHFSMAGPSAPREVRPLHLAVTDWLRPAKEGEPSPADSWQAFGQEPNAASFSAFLDRLSETENFKKDADFKAQTASWLTQLAEDDELRTKTFAMATEATSSCEDRVTLALNQMKNVQLVHNAEKGKYDKDLPGLVSAGREMFRLEKLEQIARDKVKTLRFVDEIEVYLGYQNKLKEPLELSSVSNEMRFFGVSHITESDLQAAELQVKTAENDQFGEWVLQWAPLHSVLERTYPKDWETLGEKKISDYSDSYRMLSDTELKPARLVGNADAERTIGARALESAEQAFIEGLRPLTDKILGRYLKAQWS